jgi:amino acid adenylation domain-containing protein
MNSAYPRGFSEELSAESTALRFPSTARIESLVAQQAARTPDEVALVFRDTQWTYRQLDARADALAAKLQAAGVRPRDLVAICLERSLSLPVALLGALKAGAAYIPLDPAYPAERLRFMLADARPVAVIASRESGLRCPPFDGPLLLTDELTDGAAPAIATAATSADPAYVIYTSGSTGTPKGVVVTHRNVVNFFTAMDAVIGSEPGVWLAVTSVGFDISVFELLWTLARGFRVVIQEEGQLASATASTFSLPAQIERHGVTHLQCTPSLAAMLARDPQSLAALRGLRRLLVGGEALAGDLAQRLRGSISGELFNLYGPTETTIWSASHRVNAEDERVPIGRPIANTQVYVLDDERRPVPPGTPGELYIGGEGVAAGYLNRPELTAERFVANPLSGDPADRIYRTGDIVRHDAQGRLEFLGRVDQQVKIRGARVELGEIEVVMRRHPAIRDAVAIVREQRGGDQRLIAYAVLNPAEPIAAGDLRAWVATQLPEVMVPSAVVFLDAFPMTPNGKIDRRALPEPVAGGATGTPPATETERRIAGIWADVLGAEAVGVTDRFFDVGGHSLLMVDVQGQLEDVLGFEVPLVDLFRFPTIRSFAAHLDARNGSVAEGATSGGASRGLLRQQSAGRRVAARAADVST